MVSFIPILVFLVLSAAAGPQSVSGGNLDSRLQVLSDHSPNVQVTTLTKMVEFNCEINYKMYHVVSMELRKDETERIASYFPGKHIEYGENKSMRFHATGRLDIGTDFHYFKVQLRNPNLGDAGNYSCVVIYAILGGALKSLTHSEVLEVRNKGGASGDNNSWKEIVDGETVSSQLLRLNLFSPTGEFTTDLDEISIACTSNNSVAYGVDEFSTIGIYKNTNELIAEYTYDSVVAYGSNKTSRFDVLRYSDKHGWTVELLVKMHNPGVADSADYSCAFRYNDSSNQEHLAKITTRLQIKDEGDDSDEAGVGKGTETELLSLKKMQKEIQDLRDNLNSFEEKVTNKAAFSAALSVNRKDIRNKDQVIDFKEVHLNEGNHYQPKTGTYTAPVDGTYVFHLAMRITHYNGNAVYLRLAVNDDFVSSLYVGDMYTNDQSSITTVTKLKAQDEVKVVVSATKGSVKVIAYNYTMFSGYLLNAD